MKKVLSVCLAVLLLGSLMLLPGCGSSGGSGLDMVSSYMRDDSTVVVKFRNETNGTITHVEGKLNLFTGSQTSQTPIKTPHFKWDGTCQKGMTFEVTVKVSGAPSGLADEVNRIGFSISSIS